MRLIEALALAVLAGAGLSQTDRIEELRAVERAQQRSRWAVGRMPT